MHCCFSRSAGVALAALAVLLSPARGEESAAVETRRFSGTVTFLDANRITLYAASGKTQSFRVTPETVFGSKTKPTEFQVTDKATVLYTESSDGHLLAVAVQAFKR